MTARNIDLRRMRYQEGKKKGTYVPAESKSSTSISEFSQLYTRVSKEENMGKRG